MNIIFLDIDGVLNSLDYFLNIQNLVNNLPKATSKLDKFIIRNIDKDKLILLIEISNLINAKIVIISSWKTATIYQEVKEYFKRNGLEVIGETIDNNYNRGAGIKRYIQDNKIDNYIIIDDDIFDDYDEELQMHLVKTSFNKGGLLPKHKEKALKLFKNK